MNNRIEHIDIAKGIGIILIIISHVIPNEPLLSSQAYHIWNDVLNSFYVPLFFVLSGVFEPNTMNYAKWLRRIIKLGKYSAVFFIFGFFSHGLMFNDWTISPSVNNPTIWFLFSLIWLNIFVGILKGLRFCILYFLFFSLLGIVFSYYSKSFFFTGQAFLCIPFYLVGFYAKSFIRNPVFNKKNAIGYFSLWLFAFVFFYKEQNISLNIVTQNYLAFYVEAISGSLFVIELCKIIDSEIISYYGANSIVPMMVQFSVIWMFCDLWNIGDFPGYIASSLFVSLICGLFIPILRNKYVDVFS